MKYFIILIFFVSNLFFSEINIFSHPGYYFGDTAKINQNIPPMEFKLKNGKSFIVLQSPESEFLYDVSIVGVGFSDSKDTIVFEEVEHVDTIIIADINNDGFEELYLFTRGFSPGAYDHVFGVTSDEDKSYKVIDFYSLKPEDIKEGGVFEGYNGKDVYTIKNNAIERTFPIHEQGDTYENPQKGCKTLYYTIEKTDSGYFYKIKD